MAAFDLSHVNSASTTLDLNDGTTYSLIRPGPAGIYSVPTEPVFASIPRKLPVGVYQVSNQLRRGVAIPILVRGTNLSDLVTNIRALWAHFYVDVRADEMGSLDYTAPNGNRRRIDGALAKEADVEEWLGWMTHRPGGVRIIVPFDCPDPTFYDPTASNASGNFAGAGNVNIACTNNGDVDAYPEITYVTNHLVTLENPQVTDNAGSVFKIENTMAVSKTLVINADPQESSILYNTTNWFGQRSSASVWPVIVPGTNNLVFTATNVTANAQITVSWNDRYSTHG